MQNEFIQECFDALDDEKKLARMLEKAAKTVADDQSIVTYGFSDKATAMCSIVNTYARNILKKRRVYRLDDCMKISWLINTLSCSLKTAINCNLKSMEVRYSEYDARPFVRRAGEVLKIRGSA